MTPPVAGVRRKWVTPLDNPLLVARHGWALFRQEGLTGVLSGASRFVTELLRFIYSDSQERLYHLSIDRAAAMPVNAPPYNLRLCIIESRQDALKLASEGFDNVLEVVPGVARRLDSGAVAACAFMGYELASIDWMALSDRARRVVDPAPHTVDFTAGEACSAGAFTVRKFRGRGFAACRFSLQVRYLQSRGCRVCYSSIDADNIASQRTVERYGAEFDVVFRHRRWLGRDCYERVWSKAETSPASRRSGE